MHLRDGIILEPAPRSRDGRAASLLFDPLRHRYFRTDLATLREGGERLAAQLARWELTVPDREASKALARDTTGREASLVATIAHRYLFCRVPLMQPDAALDRTLPFVRPLMSRTLVVALVLMGLAAVALVLRQADLFLAHITMLATPVGAMAAVASLVVVKSLHELGHAFALKRRGGRVPTIGIAFIVMMPVLYTDTTDAWRLQRARDRLAVDLAGVMVELAVAVLATWAWIVLPDGGWRLAAFSLAAVSWTMSLAVNLNPFMRFDGYHVLADALDLPNLQDRAFALARWRLREALFGVGTPPPERFSRRMRGGLVLYAWLTWTYRLILFAGIALLVYQVTFKALGIILFALEIWWFILRPVWREMKGWGRIVSKHRHRPRTWAPLLPLALMIGLLVAPLDRSVSMPATFENGRVITIHAPHAARIERIAADDGARIGPGRLIAALTAPELPFDLTIARARLAEAQRKLRLAATRREDLRQARRTRAVAFEALEAVERRRSALLLASTDNGWLLHHERAHAGQFVGKGEPLFDIVTTRRTVHAYVGEATLSRLVRNGTGRFIARVGGTALDIELDTVPDLPIATLDRAEVAADLPVDSKDGRFLPKEPTFRLSFDVEATTDLPPGRFPGRVVLEVEPRSYGAAALARIWGVLLRESGF